MSKALKAITEAAAAIGVTSVREDGNAVICDYKGSFVRIWLNMRRRRVGGIS